MPISFEVFDIEELKKIKNRESSKKWYESNKEQKKEYNKKWYEANPEYNKQYYQNNREELLEKNKKWYEANSEHNKQYYQDNKEEKQEYNKQYYQDNKEEILEYKKQYHQDNKEQISEYKKQYNQRPEVIERNKKGKHKYEVWKGIRADFLKGKKYVCNSCLTKLKHEDIEVDHILCRALYPELEWDENNFQILCKKCHRIKTNKDLQLIRNEKNNV